MKNRKSFNLLISISLSLSILTSCLEEGKNMLVNYQCYGVVKISGGQVFIATPNGYFFSEAWQKNSADWENNTPVFFIYDLDFDAQTSSNYWDVTIKDYKILEKYSPAEKTEPLDPAEVVPFEAFALNALFSDTILKPQYFFVAAWDDSYKFTYDVSYSADESNEKLFHVNITPVLSTENTAKDGDEFVIDFSSFIALMGNPSLRDSLKVDISYASKVDEENGIQYSKLSKTLPLWEK